MRDIAGLEFRISVSDPEMHPDRIESAAPEIVKCAIEETKAISRTYGLHEFSNECELKATIYFGEGT